MIQCPGCSAFSPQAARYCSACGTPLGGTAAPTVTQTYPAPATDPRPGERFAPGQVLAGRYRIVARLGAGGMGEVYRADDLTLGQPVALKFLPADLNADAHRLGRFHDEARSARQVTHPNVCRVHDIGDHHGQPFLIMEFVDGEDLASLLKRVGRLPEEKAVEVARQLCSALASVHEQGLLHRDLKPANVMLDGRGRVRLTDFGVAALAGTVDDVRSGTPAYQAPEVLAGREVSVASDVFALGLVLYELFTGRKAYPAATRGELEQAYASGPPSRPSSHATGIDPDVERVILRCLAAEPRHRPRSAVEVLAALPGGDPLQAALAAGRTPSPTLVADSGGTGLLSLAVAGALFAAVLVGVFLFAWLTDQAGLHRRAPLRDPHYLRGKARDLVEQLGYPHTPADSVEGVASSPGDLVYWYRHSPTRIVHRQSPNDILGYDIPGVPTRGEPPLGPGEVGVLLDGHGALREFQARPPLERDTAKADWRPLFQAAGLDLAEYHEEKPNRDPKTHVTERRAWEADGRRVEAAARGGAPAYFWVGSAEPDAATGDTRTRLAEIFYTAVRVLALTVGVWLAWWNVRHGLANTTGARRLAGVYAGSFLVMWAFLAHHAVTLADEWAIVAAVVGGVLLNALTLWVIYLALEPSVRRLQPGWVVGWNRLLAGRWRDPLVGRDVLVGCLFGVAYAVVYPIHRTLLPEALGDPFAPYAVWMATLTAGPVGPIAAYVWSSLYFRLLDFFFLMLIYLVTRRLSLAVALWALFRLVQWSQWEGGAVTVSSVALTGVLIALSLVTLLRFGLLAFVAFGFVRDLVTDLPVTLDWQAWYATTGICTLAVVVALAGYGLVVSTGGRALPGGDGPLTGPAPGQ